MNKEKEIKKLRKKYDQAKGTLAHIKEQTKTLRSRLKKEEVKIKRINASLIILKHVARETQAVLENNINKTVTMALRIVFDQSYSYRLQFKERGSSTVLELTLLKEDKELDVLESSGGGVADVVAFALRVAVHNMYWPPLNNTIILDQPFHNLSPEYHENVGVLIRKLCEELGLQMILLTHKKNIASYADRVFTINQTRGVSSWK